MNSHLIFNGRYMLSGPQCDGQQLVVDLTPYGMGFRGIPMTHQKEKKILKMFIAGGFSDEAKTCVTLSVFFLGNIRSSGNQHYFNTTVICRCIFT